MEMLHELIIEVRNILRVDSIHNFGFLVKWLTLIIKRKLCLIFRPVKLNLFKGRILVILRVVVHVLFWLMLHFLAFFQPYVNSVHHFINRLGLTHYLESLAFLALFLNRLAPLIHQFNLNNAWIRLKLFSTQVLNSYCVFSFISLESKYLFGFSIGFISFCCFFHLIINIPLYKGSLVINYGKAYFVIRLGKSKAWILPKHYQKYPFIIWKIDGRVRKKEQIDRLASFYLLSQNECRTDFCGKICWRSYHNCFQGWPKLESLAHS